MAQSIVYRDVEAAWSETLTTRRPTDTRLLESAEFGAAADCTIVVDDDAATVGHSGDAIAGLKRIDVLETAAPVGDRRLATGFVGPRTYGRSAQLGPVNANAREIQIPFSELNTILEDHIVDGTDGNRPRESAGARLVWLLASGYVDCEDRGKVVYPSMIMEANDYRGQTGGGVLADIATNVRYDYSLLLDDEREDVAELLFDSLDRSEAYSSAVKISNAGDDNGSTIFVVETDANLVRSPENVASRAYVTHERGKVIVEKASTASRFRARDVSVSTSQAKTKAQAERIGRHYLNDHDEEDDTVTAAVKLLPADVNKIRRGHRIQARLTYAPGWEAYRWARVRSREITQPAGHDLVYRAELKLAPMADDICGDADELLADHATVVGAVGVEAGTSVWAHATISGWFGGPVDDPVTAIPIRDPSYANDGDPSTYSAVDGAQLRNDGTVAAYWVATLDDTYSICRIKGTNAVGAVAWQSYPPDRIEYWDGAAWVAIPGAYTYAGSAPNYWQLDLAEEVETTKLRLVYVQAGVGTIFGLWNWLVAGVRVYDWLAYGNAV